MKFLQRFFRRKNKLPTAVAIAAQNSPLFAGRWVERAPYWRELDVKQPDGTSIHYSGWARSFFRPAPKGWHSMFGSEAAEFSFGPRGAVPYCGFTAYTQNGMGDESGHAWGTPGFVGSGDVLTDDEVKIGDHVLLKGCDEDKFASTMKVDIDRTLRSFGWKLEEFDFDDKHIAYGSCKRIA